MGKRFVTLIAVVAAGAAMADAPPKPNGIKIGDGRLHAYLIARLAYDSAAGYFANTPGGTPTLGGELVFVPTGGLSFLLDSGLAFVNFNGNVGYTWYTGALNAGSKDLSHISSSVMLDTAFNKSGAIEFDIGDIFSRSNHSGNAAAGIGLLALYNSAYLKVPIHPGGGAITVTPGVKWDVEFFSPLLPSTLPGCTSTTDITCNASLVSRMNYSNVQAQLGGSWKFLPKTAVVADITFDYRSYFNTTPTTPGGTPDTTTNLNAMLFKGTAGLSGLITSHISTLLLVGGGGDFGGSRAATFIAQAEVAYLSSLVTARGGYLRTLSPVPVFGTYALDRGYLEVKSTLMGRLSLRGSGSFDYLTYWDASTRRDYVVSALAEINFQFVSIFSAGLSYNLSFRGSNTSFVGVNYLRHEPALTLTLSY